MSISSFVLGRDVRCQQIYCQKRCLWLAVLGDQMIYPRVCDTVRGLGFHPGKHSSRDTIWEHKHHFIMFWPHNMLEYVDANAEDLREG